LDGRAVGVVAERSGHVVQLEQPELVVSSVRQTIEASREPR
jgi:hypothetical protein